MPVTAGGNVSAVSGLGTPLRNAGAPSAGTSEVQTITLSNFGACTLSMVFGGQTATVTFAGTENNTAIDTAVTAALEALSTIGTSNVSVGVTGTTDRAIAVTFAGALAKKSVAAISATASGGSAVQATLSTNLTGSNNDLTYTAVTGGTAGNSITVAYVDPSANDAVLSVGVAGSAITVNLATGVAGAITSTAALIAAAITASVPASALVTVANKTSNDGTGVVIALSATPLAGGLAAPVAAVVETTPGVDATARGVAIGGRLIDVTNGVDYIATTGGASPVLVKVGTQS
jgi:hypothetical protein